MVEIGYGAIRRVSATLDGIVCRADLRYPVITIHFNNALPFHSEHGSESTKPKSTVTKLSQSERIEVSGVVWGFDRLDGLGIGLCGRKTRFGKTNP